MNIHGKKQNMSHRYLFHSIVINDLISDLGDTLYYLALMNYVLLVPNSKIALSIITVSEAVPILFKIILGHLADKTPNKIDVIIATQLLRCFLYIFIGAIISFKPALWIILAISLINLLSDLAGQFENSLYIPIEMQLIEEEDREQVFASTQSITSIFNIVFKLSGTALVTWISYQTLAFVNSFTFLICASSMLFIRAQLKKIIHIPEKIASNQEEKFIVSVKKAIKEIKNIANIKEYLLAISGINGLFSITTPLIVLTIDQNRNFTIINSVTTISLVGVTIAVASIIGNIFSTTILKQVSLRQTLAITISLLPLLFISFIYQDIYFCILILSLLGVLSGSINPKFYGFLMNNLSENKIGMLTGGIGTIIQLGIILSQLSLSLLLVYVGGTTISIIYLTLSLGMLIYLLKPQLKNKEKPNEHNSIIE